MSEPSSGPVSQLEIWLTESKVWAEGELSAYLDGLSEAPSPLLDAMRHASLAGGKRLRPALTRLFCESTGGSVADAVGPAVAIEMVHTYGDALLTEAFSALSAHPKAAQLVSILASAAGAVGMVGGQCADLGVDLDSLQEDRRLDAVMEVHRLKTAALFAAACEMGCVAGSGEGASHAREYGYELGMLFQATDDVIDVTGTASGIGKTPGKDADLARPTLVAALGLEGARAQAEAHAARALSAAGALGLSDGDLACRLIAFLTSRTH